MSINIAATLRETAQHWPQQRAVVFPAGRDVAGRVTYSHFTFEQLDRESDRLARGFVELGITPGTRIVLMVPPSLEFIALTFALFKVGAVVVLIDPGMGKTGIFHCLDQVEPEGFIAIPLVHAIRLWKGGRLRNTRFNVTVGRRWFWGGPTYQHLLDLGIKAAHRHASSTVGTYTHESTTSTSTGDIPFAQRVGQHEPPFDIAPTLAHDPAAIIFTSGSTGAPKGVCYEHGMFAAQVRWLRDFYQIEPGEVDLPGFPLFALFNAAMGVTTVIPDMNPTRPAQVDPVKILEAVHNQGVTQAFGSPAIWNRVSRFCVAEGVTLPGIKRILSAGAPVPVAVLDRMRQILTRHGADLYTPYGATEALPVCSISASEVLSETAPLTAQGHGTCVGKPFPHIRLKIIAITPTPLASLQDARELPPGEIGEIIVQGDVVTREYFRQPAATALAKIPDGPGFWHRMGDVGYLDKTGRLWFCGRKSHIVTTPHGPLYTECIEPIFNTHPHVYRTALVGLGPTPNQTPVLIIEPHPQHYPHTQQSRQQFQQDLQELARQHSTTSQIETYLFHPSLPVDIRHNVKISRENLAPWAMKQLGR